MKKKTLLVVAACALVLTACGTTENTISDEQTSEIQSTEIVDNGWVDEETQQEQTPENETESVITNGTESVTPEADAVNSDLTTTDGGITDVATVGEVAQNFYAAATTLSDSEVESYAADVRDMILNGDWEVFVNEIVYPVIVDGLLMEDAVDLTDYLADSEVSAGFLTAIEAETCTEMFNSEQGITMGADGQIWLGAVQNEDGSFSLKVVEINSMFE